MDPSYEKNSSKSRIIEQSEASSSISLPQLFMENISAIADLLRNEVRQSHASVSGYSIACALVTEQAIYIDHNYEHESSLVFEHAELRALAKALKNEESPKVRQIFMYGEGKVKKFKHYVPCAVCTDIIKPYIVPEASVILLPTKETESEFFLNFHEMSDSYNPHDYSIITDLIELQEKTILNEKDQRFIVDLVALGRESHTRFFLTGSASGRGGFSNFLLSKLKKTYGDLDLFCVLSDKETLGEVIASIEGLIEAHYGTLKKVVRELPPYQNRKGVVLIKIYYYFDSETEPFIDLTFSLNIDGSFIRKEYYDRNWFHELGIF